MRSSKASRRAAVLGYRPTRTRQGYQVATPSIMHQYISGERSVLYSNGISSCFTVFRICNILPTAAATKRIDFAKVFFFNIFAQQQDETEYKSFWI